MNRANQLMGALNKDQARIDRMLAQEERRRRQIADRLKMEIRRLEGMRRAY